MTDRLTAALRRTAPLRVWGALSAAYLVAYVSVVYTRQLFQPDTRYYAAMALWYSGSSKAEATETVRAYIRPFHLAVPTDPDLFTYGLTAPRLLYPALSAPFVKVFGLPGLAVVPAMTIVGFVVTTFVAVAARWGWRATLVPMLLVAVDWRVVFYGASEVTEGLTTFLAALIMLVGLRRVRLGSRTTVIWLVVLTTLMAFSRQATLIPAAAFSLAWLALSVRRGSVRNRWALPALVTTVTAVVVQIAQGFIWPGFSQITQLKWVTGTDTLTAALAKVPHLLAHIVHVDAINLTHADPALVLLIAAGAVSCVVLWRREETYLLLGSVAAALLYNVSNGTPVAFRYEMPALPFFVLSVAGLAAWLGLGPGRRADAPVEPESGDDHLVRSGTPTPA